MKLDVGQLPTDLPDGTEPDDDPYLISRLTARIVARTGDRFAFVRKFSRHFEGQDKRAGVFSDLVAVLAAVYKRNPQAVEDLAGQVATEMQSRRAAQRAPSNGGTTSPPMTPKPAPIGGN